ncbi:Exodeoxyribonuclease 7 large subunit [Phycisphaerales bacterium]|nr:Exodeoxyribonuclease 7 large subunit [Phycisphaerales bacterium]
MGAVRLPAVSRLPFDASKILGPPLPAEDAPLTVAQLCARVKSSLDAGLPASVRVAGEVSGFQDRTHWYFSLKDAAALINCVMFASHARRAGFTPKSGQQVVIVAKIDFYPPGGRVSLIVEKIEPVGAGARDLALKQLIEEVRALGWLDPARKRPLPTFPRRIAVVTSVTGAAIRDVLVTMQKRCAAVGVLTLDVRVQGDRTVTEVVQSLRFLSVNAAALGLDAVLLTRGGGSTEDLWAFNDRAVAEAVVNCSIPVVAAIGHETDTSLAELVADERCATPTQAAMRLTPDAAALRRQVLSHESRLDLLLSRLNREHRQRLLLAARGLRAAFQTSLHRARSRVEDLSLRLARRSPAAVHARTVARLGSACRDLAAAMRAQLARRAPDPLLATLDRALRARLREQAARTDSAARHLHALSPLRVLERGYSVTMRADGRVVRAPGDVGPGEAIQTRVAEGVIKSVVWDTTEPPTSKRTPAHRPKPKPPPAPPAPGLFG